MMKHIKNQIRKWMIKTNRRPLNVKILPTGVMCEQYANGLILVKTKREYE